MNENEQKWCVDVMWYAVQFVYKKLESMTTAKDM